MIYDRYARIKTLPRADGTMPRPFRVDEDWNVIYLDEERDAVKPEAQRKAEEQRRAGILSWEELDRKHAEELEAIRRLGEEKLIRLAEAPNPNWNGYDLLREQGARDGQSMKPVYDKVRDTLFPPADPNAPLPPASRDYRLPPGTKGVSWDPQHRFLETPDGKLIENPEYKRAYGATETNKAGVAWDLAKVAASAIPVLRGGLTALGAGGLVGKSVAGEAWDLTKGRGSRKGAR